MTTLVDAARNLDKSWHMFTGPLKGTRLPTIKAVDSAPNPEINAFKGKPKK
jgi:hypothetical protein